VTLRDFQRELEKMNLTFDNEEEEDRLDKIEEYVLFCSMEALQIS
jgi:hypothetical protein